MASAWAGEALHNDVDAASWCVKLKDLKRLRKRVTRSIRSGQIVPTELDDFDVRERHCGPNMYTLNEQFIKPVTAAAGGMSYALMLHPTGLKCDLFITHAWQEGVFEFLEKVIYSWPKSCHHAWCCILSNPQNLNISQLIERPDTSPFAVALRSADTMLVVPNSKVSIYSRLWCCYEAFLAYREEKLILTATAPERCAKMKALPAPIFLGLVGWAIGEFQPLLNLPVVSVFTYTISMYVLVLASVYLSSSTWRRRVNYVGALLSGYYSGILARVANDTELDLLIGYTKEAMSTLTESEWKRVMVQLSGVSVFYFVIAEVDRVRSVGLSREAKQLKYGGFSGSVNDARCSEASDELNIRREIGSSVKRVDAAINVLIDAGISTCDLRRATELGVDVKKFSDVGWSFFVFTWFNSFGIISSMYFLSALTTALAVLYGILLFCLSTDAQVFSVLVVQKITLAIEWPAHLFAIAFFQYEHINTQICISLSARVLTWSIAIVLSVLRIHRVAALPYFGRRFAQLLAARGVKRTFQVGGCTCTCDAGTATELEDDEDADALLSDRTSDPGSDESIDDEELGGWSK
eukprot:TRINITY_DN31349_c0_g1_i1.p1 TRINITY_DN31349_c0_g1~~TRINITY_DN31349_c0_g1_i1.p1  ORF type:complete len:602 (-),score=110.22 TRINITY_DN31349_c0_g1_i1:89-1825(-)